MFKPHNMPTTPIMCMSISGWIQHLNEFGTKDWDGALALGFITLLNWWIVFMGPIINLRIKTPCVGILVLHTIPKVRVVEHNLSTKFMFFKPRLCLKHPDGGIHRPWFILQHFTRLILHRHIRIYLVCALWLVGQSHFYPIGIYVCITPYDVHVKFDKWHRLTFHAKKYGTRKFHFISLLLYFFICFFTTWLILPFC